MPTGEATITSRRPPTLERSTDQAYPMTEIDISESNYNGPHIKVPNSRAPTYFVGALSVSIPKHDLIEKIEDNIMDVVQAYNEDFRNTPILNHWKICYEEETATSFIMWVAKNYPHYANMEFENILRSQMR